MASPQGHALVLTGLLAIFDSHPCKPVTLFCYSKKRVTRKTPLEGNALHPVILRIQQVVCICSRQWQTQFSSLKIALLNSQNNRRALSRGKVKSIGRAAGALPTKNFEWLRQNYHACPDRGFCESSLSFFSNVSIFFFNS